MHTYERVAIIYFAALILATPLTHAPKARKYRAVVASLFMIGLVWTATVLPESVRVWLPHSYLVAGYWIPALLVPQHYSPAFEMWLRRHDAVWTPSLVLPRFGRQVIELSYLLCYAMLPAALIVNLVLGNQADVNRYWLAVLLAGYCSYCSLPWLVSRPPRFGEGPGSAVSVASLNARVLARVSHQLITFPSGHAAVATAVALSSFRASVVSGILFSMLAAGIAFGAVLGRYHFLIDVVFGVVTGILTTLFASALALQ